MVCLMIVTECSDNCFVSFYEYDNIVVNLAKKESRQNLMINYLYSPTIIVAGIAIGTPIAAQISFGLSIGAIAASPSAMISATCTQDWIEVNTNFLLIQSTDMERKMKK